MMFTTEMVQLFAVVLGKDAAKVTEALLREGCMQFINISELEAEDTQSLSAVKPGESLDQIADLRQRIEGFLHTNNVVPPVPSDSDLNERSDVDIDKENTRLDEITAERERIRERQRIIQQEILKLEDIKRQVSIYGIGLSDVKIPSRHSFISMEIGKLPARNVPQFEDDMKGLPSLHVAMGEEDEMAHYLLISMKRDKEQVRDILARVGWTEVELPTELMSVKKDVSNELSSKLEALAKEQKELAGKVNDIVKKQEGHLKDVWVKLRVNELFYKVQENFKSSSRTVVFTGWLPAPKQERLTKAIRRACEQRCYLEWQRPETSAVAAEEVPVQFNNPRVFAPFQMLVRNFGVPQYGTIDPTPFVMPIYLIMFGLMFADVGQGLVLSALGGLGVWWLKDRPEKQSARQLSWLIVWCGMASMVFGALFGSYFGAGLLDPIWFDFHGIVSGHSAGNSVINDIFDILSITIYFGISVIALGLVFNWINVIRAKKWMELVFDKGGILGGWMYAGGVYIAYHMVSTGYRELPSSGKLFLLAGLPGLLLFVKEPYHYFKHSPPEAGGEFNPLIILNWLMQWVVELLEIFSGYLSNTLSFMRVAGLGIAHVCLMISFFTLAEMTSGIGAVIVLILGNMLVIGLEGLSAAIQALRLNYYEFFTKFFHGTGKLYTPISLSSSYK